MKNSDIRLGNVYAAKVTDKITGVRIMKENPSGGWDAVNIATNKPVRIKSAARLRGPWKPQRTRTNPGHQPRRKTADVAPNAARAPEATVAPKPAAAADTGERGAKSAAAKPLGGLAAAAQVLADAKGPLGCKELVERMLAGGLWQTTGKTPAATIYAAILREISAKGSEARFRKVGRGRFEFNG